MSEVTAILSSRVLVGARSGSAPDGHRAAASSRLVQAVEAVEAVETVPGSSTTLAELVVGGEARITGFGPGMPEETARRLFDLGFAPGALVRAVRRAPMRDPIVFRVADYDIALRRAQAGSIQVTGLS